MPTRLSPLRRQLDVMPSPDPEHPGLLMRDALQYTQTILILPPALVPYLSFFDGERTDLDLKSALVKGSGGLVGAGTVAEHLMESLSSHGFLEDEVFGRMREECVRAFAEAPKRNAAHAGQAYPREHGALKQALAEWLPLSPVSSPRGLRAIAAPHVSPAGGWPSYAAAYGALVGTPGTPTFVILGTSHYGEVDRFGLTRKSYVTPLGEAKVDLEIVDRLAERGGPALLMEDYCHSVEHSIELQVLFLQHVVGPDIRIVPVLCGPLSGGFRDGSYPEDEPGVARFLDALSALGEEKGDALFWVLGVDMAHQGRRYGDSLAARAHQGALALVAQRDQERIARILDGDARGFWGLVAEGGDPLRWCGAPPLYAFLSSVRGLRGELLRYEQWNIDDSSVVSFAGISFRAN